MRGWKKVIVFCIAGMLALIALQPVGVFTLDQGEEVAFIADLSVGELQAVLSTAALAQPTYATSMRTQLHRPDLNFALSGATELSRSLPRSQGYDVLKMPEARGTRVITNDTRSLPILRFS